MSTQLYVGFHKIHVHSQCEESSFLPVIPFVLAYIIAPHDLDLELNMVLPSTVVVCDRKNKISDSQPTKQNKWQTKQTKQTITKMVRS
jgi:hypothetical protein